MHSSTRLLLEDIVARLAATTPTREEMSRALGRGEGEEDGAMKLRMVEVPFESANVTRFRKVIKIDIALSPGEWKLADITRDPQAWSSGPRLSDSGREEVDRDWSWPHVSIRCIASLKEGNALLMDRGVEDLRCQIAPR